MKNKLFFAVVIFVAVILTFPIYAASNDMATSSSPQISASKDLASAEYAGTTVTVTGWLVDQMCAKNGKGFDGINLIQHPENHTLHCLKMSICIASGFGIYVKDKSDTYVFYKFDKNGNDFALANVVNKTQKSDHILVEVTGKVKDKTIMVQSIVEK